MAAVGGVLLDLAEHDPRGEEDQPCVAPERALEPDLRGTEGYRHREPNLKWQIFGERERQKSVEIIYNDPHVHDLQAMIGSLVLKHMVECVD